MKRLSGTLALVLLYVTCLQAQENSGPAGVYSLDGVREMASAFKLNEDSSFEFYYSYGALDRYGSGTWNLFDNNLIFNSKTFHAQDFRITDSALTGNNFTTIKIEDQNPAFYRFVYCLLKTPGGDTLINADEKGIIILPARPDTIKLLFELCAEKSSSFFVKNSKYNSYTFQFEPWIVEVYFKNFVLHYIHGRLEGKHPLLEDKMYLYSKEK